MKFLVDTDKIEVLVRKGKDIVLTPEAEKPLLDFLDGYDRYKEAFKLLQKEILKKGREMFNDFHAVKGDKVRMYVRKEGKYTAEETPKSAIKEFCSPVSYLKLDQDKVESYVAKNKKVPSGIFEKAETETLVISRKKE